MDITSEERKRILTKMSLFLLTFFIIAFFAAYFLPREQRLLPVSAIVLCGIFISGSYATKKFARNHEELAWGIAGLLMLAVFFGGVVYILYSSETSELTFVNFAFHMFILWLPASTATGFFAFEILLSKRLHKPFSFHVKRFVGRLVLAEACFLTIFAVSNVINLLAPFLPNVYLIIILSLAILTLFVAAYVLTKGSKVGHLIVILERGEW